MKKKPEPRATCTIAEACALTNVSRRTVYNWMDQNLVTVLFTPGGNRRLLVDELLVERTEPTS